MSHIKLSVVTVSFNAAATIEETIQSVINQSYKNVEYIIIDGGSTDGTIDIIEKYRDKIAYFVSEKDYGLYHAMNKGIEKATGEIIGMINSDDYYLEGAFEKVVKAFEGKKLEEHIFFGDMLHGDSLIRGWRPEALKMSAFGAHPSMFCPKIVYERIGGYKLAYKILSDYDFMYRAFNVRGLKPIYLPEPIAYFRPGGLASKNIFRSYTEEMLIKYDNGEKLHKAFGIYLMKLLRYYVMKLFGMRE